MSERVSVLRQIEAVDLVTRRPVCIRVDAIGALIGIKDGGPTRLVFVGGGTLDICGDFEIHRRHVRMAEIISEPDEI